MILDISNLKQHHRRFERQFADAVDDEIEDSRQKLLKTVDERPRFNPQTGRTQKATTARVIRLGGKTIIVRGSNKLKHAAALDKGARPHIIRARRAKALRFRASNGAIVYAKSVRHPGNKPYRFLYGATMAAGRSFRQSMSVRMRSLARNF